MKKFVILAAGVAVAAAAVPATMAVAAPAPAYGMQAWQNTKARQARIEAQINQGIRSGELTRREVTQLRNQLRTLQRLEVQYQRSRPGLTLAERRDLDRRFTALERNVQVLKNNRERERRGRR